MLSDLLCNLITDSRIIFQILFCILSALSDLIALVGIPCTGLGNYITAGRQIQDISYHRNTFSEHNIKLCFLKRRRNLIFHYFDTGTVTDDLTALLQCLNSSDIQSYRRIELQCPSTGGGLRVTEHDTYLLTKLVDKNNSTVGFADHSSQLTQCLGHQSRLQTHMAVSHIPVDLRLRYQCSYGVHYNDINSPGTHHGLGDLQCLLSVIRLGNVQIINIHSDILRIDGIQGMLCIDKSGNASPLLYLSDHM